MTECVCGSGKLFHQCCMPFLDYMKFAPTPEKLMRSRFSAYALGGYGDYLLRSWLPTMTEGLDAAVLSQRDTQWQSLCILNARQQGDDGYVEFKADYLDEDNAIINYQEKSVFKRIKGKWLYVGVELK
ncbi:MAG: SEC-C motif-containing protein [Candidatus Endobugula sp.]|jgi:SEC-C motif-containing protein